MRPQGQSWDASGEPKTSEDRPKATPSRSRDAPETLRDAFRALLQHRAPSNTRVASANPSPSSVRGEFSFNVGAIAKSPKLEIHAPTQCFVRVRGLCGSVRTRNHKHRQNCRCGLENRGPERPGGLLGALGRSKSGGKSKSCAQVRAEKRLRARVVKRFFLKWVRTRPVGARKCALRGG